MTIDADEYFSQMEKPVPPNDRLLAQAGLVVQAPDPAPPPAARGPDAAEAFARAFYGQETAQDRAEPATGKSPPKRQRPLSGLLTGLNASTRRGGRRRRTSPSRCMAAHRWTASDTTRSR
jgi:hypothetical protein